MQPNTARAVTVIALLVVVVAAAFVEQRLLRAVLVIAPALFIAQRALLSSTPAAPAERVGGTEPERAAGAQAEPAAAAAAERGRASEVAPGGEIADGAAPPRGEDRRTDLAAREHVHRLLEVVREFYATCHRVEVGELPPAKARAKAKELEDELNAMTKAMMAGIGPGQEV